MHTRVGSVEMERKGLESNTHKGGKRGRSLMIPRFKPSVLVEGGQNVYFTLCLFV